MVLIKPKPLRTLVVFIFVVTATFLIGAFLSCPVYLILSDIAEIRYYKVLHFSILLTGIFLGLWYLKTSRQLKVLGSGNPRQKLLRQFAFGFAGGLVVLVIVEGCLFGLGMRQIDPDFHHGPAALTRVLTAALLSGLAVGMTEELLFRGVIFTGLARYSGCLYALLISSLFYSAVHFLDFRSLPSGSGINWLTGITSLTSLLHRFGDPEIYDSFLSLFVLGVLFGMARWSTGNIVTSAGLHAGIVATNKIFSFVTDYREGSRYLFLVNSYDNQTGYLATFWLVAACILYYLLFMRGRPALHQQD